MRRTEHALEDVAKELEEVATRRSELLRVKRDALDDIRKAARDEGQLPLFDDLDRALSVARIGKDAAAGVDA